MGRKVHNLLSNDQYKSCLMAIKQLSKLDTNQTNNKIPGLIFICN